MRYKQGYFAPTRPDKYTGDSSTIVYRSSWEQLVMIWLDTNDRVLKWSSEETIIPYRSQWDGRMHRYFVDFRAKIQQPGRLVEVLLEVKPEKQTKAPRKSKNMARYLQEMKTWQVNQDKWAAARAVAAANNMTFLLVTEKTLGMKSKR